MVLGPGLKEHAGISDALVVKAYKPFSDSCGNSAKNLPQALDTELPLTVRNYVFDFILPRTFSHLLLCF